MAVGLLALTATLLLAHEGHKPMPSKGSEVDRTKGLVKLSAKARAALDVQTAEIAMKAPPDAILAYATLVSPWKNHAFAVSRLPGRIVAIHAKPGQVVRAGELLAEVESQETERLRLELQNALVEWKLAEKVVSGLKGSANAVSESSLLAADAQWQQAKNALELGKLKWNALELSPDVLESILKGAASGSARLPIRGSVAGTVIHADLTIGKTVEPGEHLFEIVDLTRVWARIGVLERDLNQVKVGQPVSVKLTAYPQESFAGTIAIVGQFLDPVTHLNDVWVEFSNSPGKEPRLLPGMSGQAQIEIPARAGTKWIPADALVNDGVDRFVLVEEGDASGLAEYRKKSLVVMRETPAAVEVRSPDLFPGDRVVTRGSHELGTFFAPEVLRLTPEAIQTIGLINAPVAEQAIESVVEVPALVDLTSERRNSASPRLGGTLLSIRVEPGQTVQPDQVLAEVFSQELLNWQLELLRDTLAADLAKEQWNRLRAANDSISNRRLVDAEAAHADAENRRQSMMTRLQLLGIKASELTTLVKERKIIPSLAVRATVGGTIVRFDQVIGQTVRADEPLLEIHDATRPLIQAFVSEQNLSGVRLGQPARIRLTSDPETIIEGKVVRSGRVFGPADRTLSVWIEPAMLSGRPLRQDQMARVALILGSAPPTLAVPREAILQEGTEYFAFVREMDTYVRRRVEPGRSDDRFVEVQRGLLKGEIVAIRAIQELQTAFASVR